MKSIGVLIGWAYVGVGVLHSVWLTLTVSRSDCLSPEGLIDVFCNTGMGISHFMITLGWPLYYV